MKKATPILFGAGFSGLLLTIAIAALLGNRSAQGVQCHTRPDKTCDCYIARVVGDVTKPGGWGFQANVATCEMIVKSTEQTAPVKP